MNLINLLVSESVWWGLPEKLSFLKTIVSAIESVLWPVLIVVATVGSIYAIYLGINMAKAEDSSKRDEAKKHVINAVIAMVVTVVLILLIQLVLIPNIPVWVSNIDDSIVSKIEAKDSAYDTRDEVEGVLGSAYSTQDNVSTYRVKVSGKNYEITVTYGDNGAVSSVTKTAA